MSSCLKDVLYYKQDKPGYPLLSEDNSSRGYMELFGERNLLHRTKEELAKLAMLAGVKKEHITVDQEPLGINLFLRSNG